jgi:hypothetical protein
MICEFPQQRKCGKMAHSSLLKEQLGAAKRNRIGDEASLNLLRPQVETSGALNRGNIKALNELSKLAILAGMAHPHLLHFCHTVLET